MTCSEQAVPTPVRPYPETSTTQVVVENVGSCNMRCTYCFPEHMWQREGRHGAMREDTYRGILERVFSTTTSETVDVHLAGGEPLLAGQRWLAMALRVAREIATRHGKRATFSLQTNATLVTSELARFLADNDVQVGVSIDGAEDINEAVRGHSGETTRGFWLLAEAVGKRPGVIVTVTRSNARRMREVVDYLETLGVVTFRANLMGATAPWNAHAAPQAEEWLIARQDIFDEIAARQGRIMEVNVGNGVLKLVGSLLDGTSPFGAAHGCCAMRCPAGRELMYFDQSGNAYPCPRANVTPTARIGHWADDDFLGRWDEAARELDRLMVAPPECRRCPAQLVCDFGCHAFNVGPGNFFEVNCDATKDYFPWAADRLEDVARINLYVQWRVSLKAAGSEAGYEAVTRGTTLSAPVVEGMAAELRHLLDERLRMQNLSMDVLDQRYGWNDGRVPIEILPRQPRAPQSPIPTGRR
jgi:uncharacterized protein